MSKLLHRFSVFIAAFIFLLSAAPASALYLQSGDNLTLPSDRSFDETVMVAGDNLTINSPISGDLFCAGRNIVINARIDGSVYCAGQSLRVSGTVTGNLRLAGQTIDTDAAVTQNSSFASQTLTIRPQASLGRDLLAAGQSLEILGPVGRDAGLAADSITINSLVNRHAKLAANNVNIGDTGRIAGNVDYWVEQGNSFNLDNSKVGGTVNRYTITSPQTKTPTPPSAPLAWTSAWLATKVLSVISFLLVGLALLTFARRRTLEVSQVMATRPLVSFLVGFAVLFLTPIFFIFSLATLIGIPLAFIILLVYFIGLIIASVITSLNLGTVVASRLNLSPNLRNPTVYLLIGVVLLWILFSLPLVGWLLVMISLCLGLGAYFISFLPASTPAK